MLGQMLSEFLRRFREAGVPGAPSAAGAPADPVLTLEAELAPIFATLKDAEDAAEALEAAGFRQAEQCRTAAAEQARALLDDARSRMAGEQAAAAAALLARSEGACAELRRQAADETIRIEAAVTQHIAQLAADIADGVFVAASSAATP